jgi:hypothetical protein
MTCIDVALAAHLRPGPVRGHEHDYHCPGPGHANGDQRASLRINTLKNCFMCSPCGAKGTAWQLAAFLGGLDPSDKDGVKQWVTEHGLSNGSGKTPASGKRIVAEYRYHDEAGAHLYGVVRFVPKDFRQRRPDGTWGLNGVRRVLYRLPELAAAETVYIVEGEKDVDALRAIGVTATCNPGGAGKWREEYSASLKPHQRVVIIPDNDEPGRKHSQQVAASLSGKVASVKILELPGLPDKGDVSDWLAAGGNRAQLERLAAALPEYAQCVSNNGVTMQFTRLGDLLNEPEEQVRWLVEGHLPGGGDSLLVAKPKVGKSTLARCLALAVARGDDFLGCRTSQGPVFYLALEEKRSEVKRHFQAMGARQDDPIFVFCSTAPADGLAQLRAAAEREKPVLIIVDPLFRFTRIKDGNDYAAVTNALEPLHAFARECGAHVLAVHHAGKRGDGGDSVLGSTALFGAVDTLLLMKRSDRYRTLSSIQRYGTDLEEITLDYDSDTRTLSAGVARSEADEAEARKAISEYLATQTEPVEENLIHEAIEARRATKQKALRKLVDAGKVKRTGTGKKGDRYRYQNAGTQVPDIYGVPGNQNLKSNVSDGQQSSNGGTGPFGSSEHCADTREPAFSNVEREEFEL